MCRSIKTLYNIEPAATDEEIRSASLQFVRKLSGYRQPSKANAAAFQTAVDAITAAAHDLLDALESGAAPRSRATLAAKASARGVRRSVQRDGATLA
jgi:hypothetical protein